MNVWPLTRAMKTLTVPTRTDLTRACADMDSLEMDLVAQVVM